jgi:hypothetical protein
MVVRYAALQQDQCGGHWDLFLLVYKEAHCAGHQCWHLVDPAHPAYSQDAAERLADPLLGWCGTGPHRLNRHCRRRWGAHRRARPGCGRGTTCTMDSAWRLPGLSKGAAFDAPITDLGPTVAHRLGVNPQRVDGQPIPERAGSL